MVFIGILWYQGIAACSRSFGHMRYVNDKNMNNKIENITHNSKKEYIALIVFLFTIVLYDYDCAMSASVCVLCAAYMNALKLVVF